MGIYKYASINEKINVKGNSVNNNCVLNLKRLYDNFGMSDWGVGLYKIKPDNLIDNNWR